MGVFNNLDLKPLDLLNGLALGCYQPSPEVSIKHNMLERNLCVKPTSADKLFRSNSSKGYKIVCPPLNILQNGWLCGVNKNENIHYCKEKANINWRLLHKWQCTPSSCWVVVGYDFRQHFVIIRKLIITLFLLCPVQTNYLGLVVLSTLRNVPVKVDVIHGQTLEVRNNLGQYLNGWAWLLKKLLVIRHKK